MTTIEHYIENTPGELKAVVTKLRSCVMSVSDEFTESIKWGVPTYGINKLICSIMAHKNHVNLQLVNGSRIKGCDNLIGSGKNMRHIKFQHRDDVDLEMISAVIQQAIEIDSE